MDNKVNVQAQRCVIVGNAEIGDYGRAKEYLRDGDFLIFCDGGLAHTGGLGRKPDLIIGDFDSYPEEKARELGAEMIVLPCEKDDTDTVFATKEGLKRGFGEFLLLGVIGQRLDHTLGNVAILEMLEKAGCRGTIVDDYSEMTLVGAEPAYIDSSFSYFSLLNIGGNAEGVNIEGAKYTLHDAVISTDYQYGVSNEVACRSTGRCATVSVARGELLLIKVF